MLIHPSLRRFNSYEDYKIALLEWDSMPRSVAKIHAEDVYKNIIKRKEKSMAITATITKRQGSPAFVWGSFGMKIDDLIPLTNSKGYVNFDLLESRDGGYYAKVNEYGLTPSKETAKVQDVDISDGEIPF